MQLPEGKWLAEQCLGTIMGKYQELVMHVYHLEYNMSRLQN